MDLAARPTQQERSARTQQKLVEATIDALVELGIARLTTTEVGKRAGTSQGSIFKHFPSKAALISSAVAALYDGLLDDYAAAVSALPADANRVDACIDALWQLFQTPRLLAVYDLHISARTDPTLRSIVEPMERAHRAKIRQLAAALFPNSSTRPEFLQGIELVINCAQGAAVGSMALHEPEIMSEMLTGLKAVARVMLGGADA
jgi:AcrR family transcriptional regulator